MRGDRFHPRLIVQCGRLQLSACSQYNLEVCVNGQRTVLEPVHNAL